MRHALAVIAAVLVLGGAVGGAYWWLDQQVLADRSEPADPADTVATYLTAWEAGDHDAMSALVRDPEERFTDDHQQLRDGLELTELRAEVVDLRTDVDGRATAQARVTADSVELGALDWEVELRLLRERGTWGVAWAPTSLHPDWQPGLRFDVEREPVDRAAIVARDGTVLAGPGERVTYGFDPGEVPDGGALADAFDTAVSDSGDAVRRLYDGGGLVDGWFYPVVSLPADEARDRTAGLRGEPGVLRRVESGARVLLADGFALHVVGRVAEATAEQLEQLGDAYQPGDLVGQFGLEAALEDRLAAGERLAAVLRDGSEGPVRTILAEQLRGPDGTVIADAGGVETTLDVTVQRAVENTLLARAAETGLVVVDGADGAIRAAASRPLTGFDRALAGRYAPGVAFGPVLEEARAASGESTPDAAALLDATERFGFGHAPRLPLAAFTGSFPEPVDPAETRRAAQGQGRVEVSVLAAASFAAAAVEGRWHPPYLLEEDGPGEPATLSSGATDAIRELLSRTTEADDAGTDEGSEDAAGDVGSTDGEADPTDDGRDEAPGAGGTAGDVAGVAGTAEGTGGTPLGWFVGTVDGLGYAIVIEGGSGEDARGLAARFTRELAALQDRPADLDDDSVP